MPATADPDLVLGRIDFDALSQRIEGGWLRPQRDRIRMVRIYARSRLSAQLIADKVGVTLSMRPIARIERDRYARTERGTFIHIAPIRLIVDRVIAFEAKRLTGRLHWPGESHRFADRGLRRVRQRIYLALCESGAVSGGGVGDRSPPRFLFRCLLSGRKCLHYPWLCPRAERALGRLLGRPLPHYRSPDFQVGRVERWSRRSCACWTNPEGSGVFYPLDLAAGCLPG
jgi:hypothetical protein